MLQPNINIAKQQKSRWFVKRQGTEIIRTKQGKAFILRRHRFKKIKKNLIIGSWDIYVQKVKIKSTVNKLISDEEIVSENNQEHYHDSGLQYFTPHRKSRQRKNLPNGSIYFNKRAPSETVQTEKPSESEEQFLSTPNHWSVECSANKSRNSAIVKRIQRPH